MNMVIFVLSEGAIKAVIVIAMTPDIVLLLLVLFFRMVSYQIS